MFIKSFDDTFICEESEDEGLITTIRSALLQLSDIETVSKGLGFGGAQYFHNGSLVAQLQNTWRCFGDGDGENWYVTAINKNFLLENRESLYLATPPQELEEGDAHWFLNWLYSQIT